MSIINLDHAFDEFVKAHEPEIVKAIPRFTERLGKTQFRYGRFAIPTFYKALFLTRKQIHMLKRVASTLSQVLNTATRLYFEEGHMAHHYRISPEAAELIRIDPGYSQNVVLTRFDGLLQGESLKLVELNCDSPAGAAYTDQAESLFLSEEPIKPFVDEYHLHKSERVQGLLDALLAAYEEFGGYEIPNIALVDWRHVRTKPELEFLKVFFESRGYKTTIADPRELKYKSGRLYHKGFRIHLLYRRVLFDELLERLDEVEDMIKAYRDRAICMVNPLRSRLASTKALLSILTNPQFDHYFTENENKIKREHIPWTRRLLDAEDFYGKKKIYLIDFLKDEKDTLVLKPASGTGGKGVTIGKETRDQDWNATIDKALKGDWVVQEYVDIPIMTVPVPINDKIDSAYKKYNFNILVSAGKYSGGFVRLSEESVINVARGGGLIPSLESEMVPERFGA
ncbi:MAG: glutathionylspermidine synthase family protein [Candidatus Omnitrophota bacterium]|nr:glutathionylspermidine synthase family protein [Candidatus Omnitrophota bacterium]